MNRTFTFLLIVLLSSFFFTATANFYGKPDFSYKKIREFIPDGYQVYDTASGDFNADGYTDYILVLQSIKENANSGGERPLLLLSGAAKGKLELLARNDHVVLCSTCGGVFGDPYQKISINGSYISVEHGIGGNWQWSRVITFKYDTEKKEMLLYEDITKSYRAALPANQKSVASNKTDFGSLPFSSFAYNKGF